MASLIGKSYHEDGFLIWTLMLPFYESGRILGVELLWIEETGLRIHFVNDFLY